MSRPDDLAAAGTVPWRHTPTGGVEVLLVHRVKYDDWSWPKGKLDDGEDWPQAAARETWEETGLRVRLGIPLPSARYPIENPSGKVRRMKEVRYWAATVLGGDGALENEIDEVRWVSPKQARSLLTYPRDRDQLDALLADGGPYVTRPLLVVRHAKALPRKQWSGHDWLRPLDELGYLQAVCLVGVLDAYGVESVVCSPSTRCADTIRPFLEAGPRPPQTAPADSTAGVTLGNPPVTTWADPLSEEGYEDSPHLLAGIVTGAVSSSVSTVICSHGPVLPALVGEMMALAPPRSKAVRQTYRALRDDNLIKGEAVVAHLSRVGDDLATVALERHAPRPSSKD